MQGRFLARSSAGMHFLILERKPVEAVGAEGKEVGLIRNWWQFHPAEHLHRRHPVELGEVK